MKAKIVVTISIILVIFLSTITLTYSKFTEKTNGTLNLSVAKPICNLIIETENVNLSNLEPCSIYFEVNNYNSSQCISEVAMQYYICICFTDTKVENYPECTLYMVNDNGTEQKLELITTASNLQTETYIIYAQNMEIHKYKLKLSNPNTESLSQLCINLESIQVEPKA